MSMINIETLKEIINSWDPVGLFPTCPQDEYNSEIKEIFTKVQTVSVELEDLAQIVYDTFKDSFGSAFSLDLSECKTIAQKIIDSVTHETSLK